jgi:hypothetical protein
MKKKPKGKLSNKRNAKLKAVNNLLTSGMPRMATYNLVRKSEKLNKKAK